MLPGNSGREKKPLVELSECLLGGDREQLSREHRVRREALLLSILFQVTVLAALVLVPLFGSVERIVFARTDPRPPYVFVPEPPAPQQGRRSNLPPSQPTGMRSYCVACEPVRIPPRVPVSSALEPLQLTPTGSGLGEPMSSAVIPIPVGGPTVPFQGPSTQGQTPRLRISALTPGMLLHRVEPVYPWLALQTRREGRIEIVAVISTDGSVQSLVMAGGDPLFFPSARDAVSQWRFRPTVLNGAPVEVETHITVIYQLPR